MVVTPTPMFGPEDTGPVKLREGVWRAKADEPCRFDEARLVGSWPGCANVFVVMNDKLTAYDVGAKGERSASVMAFLLAGGTPVVLQLPAKDADPSADNDGYVYLALRPGGVDAGGRITAFTAWPALCGPPPPTEARNPDGHARYGTLVPLAGLTMDRDDNNCSAASPDAVRASALASEPWATQGSMLVAHWVRDGDR
ncbi:MAG TPA: hypothetical protein VFE13_06370 [Caulobacteraceae bacterium]|nr:hypothetical protein [Caulobacteraceae bacterium]